MHFVRVQRRLNRVTGIEVFIWLMSYELQGCQLFKTPKMERSSDPLKVRETGNDFWLKIRRDEPFKDLSTEIIERLATGDATVEDLHAAASKMLLRPKIVTLDATQNHLPSLASIPHRGGRR